MSGHPLDTELFDYVELVVQIGGHILGCRQCRTRVLRIYKHFEDQGEAAVIFEDVLRLLAVEGDGHG